MKSEIEKAAYHKAYVEIQGFLSELAIKTRNKQPDQQLASIVLRDIRDFMVMWHREKLVEGEK